MGEPEKAIALDELPTDELIKQIKEHTKDHYINPCDGQIFDLLEEALTRLWFLTDSNRSLEEDNKNLRKGLVAQCHCRHFKGLQDNDYSDCLVVCDEHQDDYVSMAHCQFCPQFELAPQYKETHEVSKATDS